MQVVFTAKKLPLIDIEKLMKNGTEFTFIRNVESKTSMPSQMKPIENEDGILIGYENTSTGTVLLHEFSVTLSICSYNVYGELQGEEDDCPAKIKVSNERVEEKRRLLEERNKEIERRNRKRRVYPVW